MEEFLNITDDIVNVFFNSFFFFDPFTFLLILFTTNIEHSYLFYHFVLSVSFSGIVSTSINNVCRIFSRVCLSILFQILVFLDSFLFFHLFFFAYIYVCFPHNASIIERKFTRRNWKRNQSS